MYIIEMKNAITCISNLTKKLTHAILDQEGFKHSLEKQWSQIHFFFYLMQIKPLLLVLVLLSCLISMCLLCRKVQICDYEKAFWLNLKALSLTGLTKQSLSHSVSVSLMFGCEVSC